MTIRRRLAATITALALATTGLLAASAPAQATATEGCRVLSPWAVYPLTGNVYVKVTNRFIAQGCGGATTEIDTTQVKTQGGVGQCEYMRVELFDSSGRSMGAFTVRGAWTWQLQCDDTLPNVLLDDVPVGTKYDVQVTTQVPVWLGQLRD